MSHMHGLGNFPVDGPGLDTGFVPELLGVLRGTLEEPLDTEGFAVFHQACFRDLVGEVIDIAAFRSDAPFPSDSFQLFGVFHLIGAALFGLIQCMADLAAMVRVGRSAAGGKPEVIPSDNAVNVAAADAAGRLWRDAAGPMVQIRSRCRLRQSRVGRLVLTRCCQESAPTFLPVSSKEAVASSICSTVIKRSQSFNVVSS